MSSRWVRILSGVLALAVAWWIYDQWNGSERQIRRRLGQVADAVEKDGPENGLVAANRSRKIGEFLSRDFEVRAEPFAGVLSDRARFSQVIFQYRSRAEKIAVDLQDVELTVDDRLRIADMAIVARISGTSDAGRYREGYRFRLRWVEEDGEWRIQQVELVEVLEGPAGLF